LLVEVLLKHKAPKYSLRLPEIATVG